MFARLAARLSYVSGDFSEPETYERDPTAIGGAVAPGVLPRDPARPVRHRRRRARGGRADDANARVIVEKPFGHDLASARALAAELHRYLDESQIFRIDHYLGKMGLEEILLPPLRQHDARTGVEPELRRERADHDGRGLRRRDRGHFYDPVGALRDVVVNHLMQVVAAAAMEAPAGRRPARRCKDAPARPCSKSISDRRSGRTTSVASTTATGPSTGVAPGSKTETYAALSLEIENWRWSGSRS